MSVLRNLLFYVTIAAFPYILNLMFVGEGKNCIGKHVHICTKKYINLKSHNLTQIPVYCFFFIKTILYLCEAKSSTNQVHCVHEAPCYAINYQSQLHTNNLYIYIYIHTHTHTYIRCA